ncbi:MAG TPA: TIGR04255 family protein [Thermoanaerobaculia bacterium]|jgi:uncharacterized protein (TIGR04255 family)
MSVQLLRSDREIYPHSPVVEAVIDFRCTNRPNFTVRDVLQLANDLSGEFVQEGDITERMEEVRVDGGRRTTERPVGVLLRRIADQRVVAQLQVEGFTYSHVAPYERWEHFREGAEQLWSSYAAAGEPQAITRVGVRFINRIEVGASIEDFATYLSIYPATPRRLAIPPDGFALQLRQPVGSDVLVTKIATMRHAETEQLAILLDLEASFAIEAAAPPEALWNAVERLHVLIGDAFESAITNRVREIIR